MKTLEQELKETLDKASELIDFLEEDGELSEHEASLCNKGIDLIEQTLIKKATS